MNQLTIYFVTLTHKIEGAMMGVNLHIAHASHPFEGDKQGRKV